MSDTGADTVRAQQRLAELRQTYPLPAAWTAATATDDDDLLGRADIGSLSLYMVGVVARRRANTASGANAASGANVTRQADTASPSVALGSACACETYPVDRAYFELLERISVLEARHSSTPLCVRALDGTELSQRDSLRVFPRDLQPERQRLALSNGVALHTTWADACAAALSELVERDRVLRAWQGQCAKTAVSTDGSLAAARLQSHYSVRAYELGTPDSADSADSAVAADGAQAQARRVVGFFLFPHAPDHPFVYGFAAATQLANALARAETEALQRLAFLWGEPLPQHTPKPTPAPDYHQDYYLYPPNHAHILRWLEGDHALEPRRSRQRANAAIYDGECTQFIDLTPESLRGRLSVAKAVSTHARRLRFGALRDEAVPHPIA